MSSNKLYQKLLERMPYSEPFFFVDDIIEINEKKIKASYYLSYKLDFYKGHFKNKPITPGAILIEVMGQVGCVLHGIYLFRLHENIIPFEPFVGAIEVNFFKPVYPNTNIIIEGELNYLRQNYISSTVSIYDKEKSLIAISKIQCNFTFYE